MHYIDDVKRKRDKKIVTDTCQLDEKEMISVLGNNLQTSETHISITYLICKTDFNEYYGKKVQLSLC